MTRPSMREDHRGPRLLRQDGGRMTNDVAMVRKFLYMIRRGRRPIILRSAERPLTVPTHTRKEHAVSDAET